MTKDISSLPEIDVLGTPLGWRQGTGDWAGVRAAIARGDSVQVIQEAGSTLWQAALPAHHPFQFGFPEFTAEVREDRPTPKRECGSVRFSAALGIAWNCPKYSGIHGCCGSA